MKTTLSSLRKEAIQSPKFVLFTNEFGYDIFIANSEKTDMPITDTENEALQFSVGFDNVDMKLKSWSYSTGYNLQAKYI